MIVIEYIKMALLLILGIIASVSDIRKGIIRNRDLSFFSLAAIILDVINYGFLARDLAIVFLLNLAILLVTSIILFFIRVFAGGDTKLLIVFALLYPAEMYVVYGKSQITLLLSLLIALIFGYLYLLGYATIKLIKKENKVNWRKVGTYLLSFLKNYIAVLIYITGINLIFLWISIRFITIPFWVSWIICIAAALLVGRIKVLKKIYILIAVAAADIVFAVLLHTMPVSTDPKTYIVTVILVLCQMTMQTNLYEAVSVDEIKAGMILSAATSLAMQASKIQGLPGVSKENLESRLTEDEAASVQKWVRSINADCIYVVRKIPFAIFLLTGFVCYFIIWGITT